MRNDKHKNTIIFASVWAVIFVSQLTIADVNLGHFGVSDSVSFSIDTTNSEAIGSIGISDSEEFETDMRYKQAIGSIGMGDSDSFGFRAELPSEIVISFSTSQATRVWDVFGDLNNSGRVDLSDFALLAANWMGSCDSVNWCDGADTELDGDVDAADLLMLAEYWLD